MKTGCFKNKQTRRGLRMQLLGHLVDVPEKKAENNCSSFVCCVSL